MLTRNVYIVRRLRSFQCLAWSTLTRRYASTDLPYLYEQWVTEQEVKDGQAPKDDSPSSAKEKKAISQDDRNLRSHPRSKRGWEKQSTNSPASSTLSHFKTPGNSETKATLEEVSRCQAKSRNDRRAHRSRQGSSRHNHTRLVRKILQPKALLVPKARKFSVWRGRWIVIDVDPLAKRKKQPVRSQYKSLRSWKRMHNNKGAKEILEPLSTLWSQRFAIISRDRNGIFFRGAWEKRIQHILGREMDRESIIRAWKNIRLSRRETRWHETMIWALLKSPERALKLLDASVTTPTLRPARHVVEDCINYLSMFYLQGKDSPDPLKIDTLVRIICNFAEASVIRSPSASAMPQHAIFLLLQHCDNDQALFLFETLRRRDAVIHENTLLHFLDRFVDMGEISLSLEILQNLVTSGIDVTSDKIQSACVRFLRFPFQVDNRYNIQSSVLAAILEIGIRPKISMYNAIILNTIQAGDYQTAWQMYEMARENSLEPDAITYSTMLKGAKLNQDPEIIDRIIRDAEGDGSLPRDERLIRDVLNAVLAVKLSKFRWRIFTALLPTYTRYRDIRPLQELGMVPSDFELSETQIQVPPPSPRTVGLMVLAYIRQHHDSDILLGLYMRYHSLIQEQHPIIAPLAETDHIANAFILALSQKSQSLGSCTLVIKHMLQSQEAVAGTKLVKAAIPTVQTWSILIAAYFRHGQKLAAEKVLRMMAARGLQPNNVTWNILVSGYSQMQDIDNAVGAIQQMEISGFKADSRTLEGLGRLRDRDRVLEALKRAIEAESDKDDLSSTLENVSTTEASGAAELLEEVPLINQHHFI